MTLSVVIPHYKDKDRLLLLLENLESQTLAKEHWEVIVVNNDPSLALILSEDFSVGYRLRVLEELKPGSYAARNKGIREACGNVIAFTDSDCLPSPDWLKNGFGLFSRDFKKEIGVLTGPVPLFFKDENRLSDAEVYEKYTGFTTKVYAQAGHAITANWFSYKSVLEEFGGFDDRLKSNGDSELSGRISHKYAVVHRDDVAVAHPARFRTEELVSKYRRLLGGAFTRKFQDDLKGFRNHILEFVCRRYRFAFKKLATVPPKESLAILRVCHAVNKGAIQEYRDLVSGKETKR